MATPSSQMGAKRKRNDPISPFGHKKPELPENSEKRKRIFTFNVLLPNGLNSILTLENPDEEMSVTDFVRTVRRKCEKEQMENGTRPINWGHHVYLEDTLGNRLKNGKIIPRALSNKSTIIILQDGGTNSVHTYQDMWDVTPEPHLLVGLPQEYTTATALADLIDNSLQAVWENGSSDRKLISVKIGNKEISIFDSGQGMDGSKENSIAKWGTMGSSNHRGVRVDALGGKPPYLKPYFGMYGYGGLAASLHLGGVVMVSSKTKTSKKVATLRLAKDLLVQRTEGDRVWRTPGDFRELTQEESDMSPHGSFTKVHISNLKFQYWHEDQLKCMLKDIYFPYIQNDGSDESVRTSTPVEFEVNGTNLTEVAGGEVVATNLSACNAPPFVLELHFKGSGDMNGIANARLSCFYFPIVQGRESIDTILEKLKTECAGLEETFETFCRVSIRRLGRLLPDARWGGLPFMEPKRRRTENTQIPPRCYKRVKCIIDTDAGFAPTTSKTELAHKHPYTLALKSLGRKPDSKSPVVRLEMEREGKRLSFNQLEKEYEEWIRAMHESYDEEVEGCDEKPVLILNPSNGRDLGISHNVIRVYTRIKRKGQLWKKGQRIKIVKGDASVKDLYATLEFILCEGLEGDPGEARMIIRPMEYEKESGSKLFFNDGNASFELGISRSCSLDLISSGKCHAMDEETWTRQLQKQRLKSPVSIDILNTEQVRKFDVDKGFPMNESVQAGFELTKEIIAVVRPYSYTADSLDKFSDGSEQKSIMKDSREMKMDIKAITVNECAAENSCGNDVKYTIQLKATFRNGVHGLYCFAMEGSHLLDMFKKAGRYRFIFSLINVSTSNSNVLTKEVDLCVGASDKIGEWRLSHHVSDMDMEGGEFKRLETRLGSEIGPIYVSSYDIYGNRMDFTTCPPLKVDARKNGKPLLIAIEKVSSNVTQGKMHLQVKVLLGKGDLQSLRPSFEAILRVGCKNQDYFAEMPVTVLPGDLFAAKKLSKQELDNCLRPEDVIREFKLQILDVYGNPVDKGRIVKVELIGLKFQDQSDLYRKVDDQGCVNFGGLLKVTGNYGSIGCIKIYSNSRVLFEKHFRILSRELRIISGILGECPAGSTLENIAFGIFDDSGCIDESMDGRQHSLMIELCAQDGVQYPFKKGKCIVSKLHLPHEHGTLEFKAFHSFHSELLVQIKIELLQNPKLQLVDCPEQGFSDGAVCETFEEPAILNACPNSQMNNDKLWIQANNLLNEIKEWQEDVKRCGLKVGRDEDEVKALKKHKSHLEDDIDELSWALTHKDKIISNKGSNEQGTHGAEQTFEELKSQESSAGAVWAEFSSTQSYNLLVLPNVIGVVAMLGKVETDLLSWALSEYLGKDNMMAIVCKSREAVEEIEKYDKDGKLDAHLGIHGLARSLNRHIDGRFRVICLENLRSYEGGINCDDPQQPVIIENPKLPCGSSPPGFIGYAANLMKLDPNNPYSRASSIMDLRKKLFFNLFSYLQVYENRHQMTQAMSCIKDGAISLDGGMLRCKGIIECGNREDVPVRFSVASSKPLTSINQQRLLMEEKLRQKLNEKRKVEEKLNKALNIMMISKRKFEKKLKELQEKEAQVANMRAIVCSDNVEVG